MTSDDRVRHLAELEDEFNVVVLFHRELDGCALEVCGVFRWMDDNFGVAVVSDNPAENEIAYLIALHEVGHAVVQRRKKRWTRLEEEAAAWRFAIEEARMDLRPEHWDFIRRALKNDLTEYTGDHAELLKEAEANAWEVRT